MGGRVSEEEKARLREGFRQLAAQVRHTEEEGVGADLAVLSQLIKKNDELYSNVSDLPSPALRNGSGRPHIILAFLDPDPVHIYRF